MLGSHYQAFPTSTSFKMKAEILVHPHETGLGVLSNAPNIARLPIRFTNTVLILAE